MFNIFNRGNNTPKSEKLEDDEKKSGISRRSFLKAGSILAVPVLGALAIKDNTELKAKIFEEVSRYFGEMSMTERLKLAREEFERDYGIRLDLKSLHQTNAEAETVNSNLARKLEAVKRVANDVYQREINKYLNSSGFDIDTINQEYERLMYEVEAEFKTNNPDHFVTSFDSIYLGVYEKLELIEHMREVLALYPKDYIRSLGIKAINSGKQPYDYNTGESIPWNQIQVGIAKPDLSTDKSQGRSMYLDYTVRIDFLSRSQIRHKIFNTISHELSHIQDSMTTNDKQGAMLQEWRDKNVELGMQDYIGEYWNDLDPIKDHRIPGYYNHYSASHPAEDRATISEALWSEGKNLSEMCKNDKILAAKVEAIKAEYLALDSRFDEEYWRLLAEGKYEEVKHYVKYTVKKDPINY